MSDLPPTAGARSISEAPKPRWAWFTSRRSAALLICAAAVLVLVVWLAVKPKATPPDTSKAQTHSQSVPYEGPKTIQVAAAVVRPPVVVQPPMVMPVAPELPAVTKVTEVAKPPPRPAVYNNVITAVPAYLQQKPAQAGDGQPKEASTAIAYKSATVPGAKTMTIPDRNLLLMPGPLICIMDTAINTDVAGPFQCHLDRDALSPTNVVLMEKGTRVMGGYMSAAQEQSRVVAVTAFATTPNGVVVPLGGPIANELGAGGVEGTVDNHWFKKFGAALLLSLVDNAFQLGQSELSKAGSTNLNISSGSSGLSSLATQMLGKTIPPTITVSQGSVVALWSTTIIDFGPSYRLESTR